MFWQILYSLSRKKIKYPWPVLNSYSMVNFQCNSRYHISIYTNNCYTIKHSAHSAPILHENKWFKVLLTKTLNMNSIAI